MGRFSVGLFACLLVSISAISEFAVDDARADDDHHHSTCTKIDRPTTIATDRKCVRVVKTVAGDVVVNASVGRDSDTRPGLFIGGGGSITGSLVNNGAIKGGGSGYGALTLGRGGDVKGGIVNNGDIVSVRGDAIRLGVRAYDYHSHGWRVYAAAMTGDIVNHGLVDGRIDGIAAVYGTMSGALINASDGTISGDAFAVHVAGTFTHWSGGIDNSGLIEGGRSAILIGELDHLSPVVFAGGIVNRAGATIAGGAGPSIAIAGASFSGGIKNAGLITQTLPASPSDAWLYEGVGIVFAAPNVEGGLINAATGRIEGLAGAAVLVTDRTNVFGGGIINRGAIDGATDAVVIEAGRFEGGFLNEAGGSILARSGDGIFATADWIGAFENGGTLRGTSRGFAYDGALFDGAILNTGAIEGGDNGFSLSAETMTGAFANSGTIKGLSDTGVWINVGTWGMATRRASIVNAAGGSISGGETGFHLVANVVFGDFVNDGKIMGGGANTAIRFDVATFNGDIVNNGEAIAASNAIDLKITTLNGKVKNRGLVKATDANGIAVALAIGNGATFINEDGGIIVGDVRLGGPAAYTFVGREGGIEGSIIGNAGLPSTAMRDDVLIVEDGTHYFVDGLLRDLLRFDIDDGGIALMGAYGIGDPDGPGYGAANVGALNVNAGGRLYLDDDTVLNVGTFSQNADSELTYYLVAPTGAPVAGQDYGRIDATGAVTLAGKLSVILDAVSFGGTTQTEFNYVDIIRGGSFSGQFGEVAIEGSSYFFRLELSYGGTSIDLGVTRTPFDRTFCEQHVSRNSQDLGAAIEAAFLAGGFTPEQIEFFNFLGQIEDVCSAYFDLGGAVLGDIHAITVETAGPWKSAVNDRLNSTGATSCVVAGSGGCLTRYAQATPAAVQTMSDAEDPFAWLRTGVRPEGQFSVWGRLIGVQGDNEGEGGGTGSDFTVTGGIAGADYVVTHRLIVGLAAQWTSTDVDFKARRDTADVQSFEIGGYFSYGDVDFCIAGNASIILHDFDTYRFPFGGVAHGSYEGSTVSAYLEAGKVFEFDMLRVEPIIALSFAALDTDAYRETGTAGGNLLLVDGASHRSLKSAAGARFAYPLSMLDSGRRIVPEMRLMWGHEFLDDQAQFRAALASLPGNPFNVRGQRFSRDSLLGGVGLNVPLSANSVLYADYDVSWSRDQVIQSVSLGARVSW